MLEPAVCDYSIQAYEIHAQEFARARDHSTIGVQIIRDWAQSLPEGCHTLELACGSGYPVSRELVTSGLNLWAMDSSPTLLHLFQSRFPEVPTQCARVQEFNFFKRKFDAAIAIGILFLLSESDQLSFLQRVSEVLNPNGRFLFTVPVEAGAWRDLTTGCECLSLGYEAYVQALENADFRLISNLLDEGGNNTYLVHRAS